LHPFYGIADGVVILHNRIRNLADLSKEIGIAPKRIAYLLELMRVCIRITTKKYANGSSSTMYAHWKTTYPHECRLDDDDDDGVAVINLTPPHDSYTKWVDGKVELITPEGSSQKETRYAYSDVDIAVSPYRRVDGYLHPSIESTFCMNNARVCFMEMDTVTNEQGRIKDAIATN
jgi:hypothetical protein